MSRVLPHIAEAGGVSITQNTFADFARSRPVHLISQVGFQDRDILPHWLAHYRALGVSDINLILHGGWPQRRMLAWLCRRYDVKIASEYGGQYATSKTQASLAELVHKFFGDWVLLADADEFVELPFGSLAATLRAMQAFGLSSLPSILIQRVSADGSLSAVDASTDLLSTFPCGHTLLVERMRGNIAPIWKSKYPLFFVHEGTAIRRGNHLSPDGGVSGFGLRAVTHHYKWRARLLSSAQSRANNHQAGNRHEMAVAAQWLAKHEGRLPVEGCFAVTRAELFRRGLLRRPTRSDIRMGTLLHRVRLRASQCEADLSSSRLDAKLARLNVDWNCTSEKKLRLPAPAARLVGGAAKIAIVTFRLSPPESTSGIATWVSTMAATLRRVGHEVTIIYVPFPDQVFSAIDREVWAARGIEVIVLERSKADASKPDPGAIVGAGLLQLFRARQFDLLHLHDAWGYGSAVVEAFRQGRGYSTRTVVTAHGPMEWYNAGNNLPNSELQLRNAHRERLQIAGADYLIGPSELIISWLSKSGYRQPSRTYVHPNLLSHSIWTGRRFASEADQSIHRLVFFGRLELIKGLALFCDTIDILKENGEDRFELIFLGKPGHKQSSQYLQDRIATWRCHTWQVADWKSEDALLLLGEPGTLAVIPSMIDNYPYSVLECLGAGIPFITTNVGGIPEMVHPDDHERVLVAPEPRALAAALQRTLQFGHAPARPAIEFSTGELQWLAWHGSLLSEKKNTAQPKQRIENWFLKESLPISIIVGGTEPPAPWCLSALERQSGVAVNLLVATDEKSFAARANAMARHVNAEFLILCGARVLAESGAVGALLQAALNTDADAVLASHHRAVGEPDGASTFDDVIHPPCGPLSVAAVENVFGGRFFLIRRKAFEDLGGFRELAQLEGVEHRDLLNRLLLRGRPIISVPFPLYVEYSMSNRPELLRMSAQRTCLEPFLADLPAWASDLLCWVQDSGWRGRDKAIEVGWSIPKDLARRRIDRVRRGTSLIKLAGLDLAQLTAAGDAEVITANGELTVTANGPDPILFVPPFASPKPPSPLHLIIDMVASTETEAQLYWTTAEWPGYAETRSAFAPITTGEHTILLSTPPIKLQGQLRFDPGRKPGQYQIRKIEVWTGPERVSVRMSGGERQLQFDTNPL
jgi:glycosyltransferase involved in cell wall biosynthesis